MAPQPPVHRKRSRARGLTLVEIMIAMFILTVGAVAFLGSFGSISKSIRVSKAKTLASNLAQEEIETLKNLSYYRLLVTTSPTTATEPGLGGFLYDGGYYPPEELTVGQIQFERRIYIQKVTESSGTIVGNTWNAADTGLKLISAYVVWQEDGEWKKVQVNNLRDNPNRQKMDATVSGDVQSSGFGVNEASVYTLQNLLYGSASNGLGAYSFKVPAGTYDFHVNKRGYFPATIRATATASGVLDVDFNVVAMASGNVTGYAYLVDHLVISELCATVDGDDALEYVEIYNPTPNAIVMYSGGAPAYRFDGKGTNPIDPPTTLTPPSQMIYVNTVIPSHGYFLFASSPSVKGVLADAYLSDVTRTHPLSVDLIPKEEPGGIALISEGINESSGTVMDAIGWNRGSSPWGPEGYREGDGLRLPNGPAHGGLQDGETIERLAYSTATHSTMHFLPSVGAHFTHGNGYDTGVNNTDFIYHDHSDSEYPQGTGFNENPGSGTPAAGGAAFVDDGLSASAVALSVGSFTVVAVATGTWNLLVSSRGYIHEQGSVIMTAGATVNVGNVFLTTITSSGYLSGRVLTSAGAPINMIRVESSYGSWDYTDVNGYYRFQIDGGTHIVTANKDNLNTLYTTAEATDVVVNAGEAVTVPDLFLFQGGTLLGYVSSNGTDPLPSIPVIATNTSGVEVGATVTDSYGYFEFPNLPIGTYGIVPQLEPGESASPAVMTRAVTAGSSVFAGTMTVTNAFGSITGLVRASSASVSTGVLIIAVAHPTLISSDYPPVNDQTLRNASVVYYTASSDADGTYSLPVRGGSTYNVYAWYTNYNGDVADPEKRHATATVTAGGNAVVNFSW